MPARERSILTPSQLNALARSLLEDTFPLVEIEGEICNLSRPASGHLYLALKDRHAQVRCALFKPKSQWLRFKPADGMQVLGRGRVTLYEPRGEYQLILEHLEPAGEGALRRAFEELKARLAAEGLFDSARKRPLPASIHRLGVLSSPSGAAIHDVLTVIARRFPLLPVELLPVPVQGKEAAAQIRAMLQRADASGRYDVLLLTRGGGSLEDLASFNDESLARAIVACRTPVVCAVGHEIDFSIADFVADLRAATPSAAAELLTPDAAELRSQLLALQRRLQRQLERLRERQMQRLDGLFTRLNAQRPLARLARDRERARSLLRRIQFLQRSRLRLVRQHLDRLAARLRNQHPRRPLIEQQREMRLARARLQATLAASLRNRTLQLAALGRALETMSPLATLSRGYAILRHDGRVLHSVRDAHPGQTVEAQLQDGRLQLDIRAVQPSADD